MALTEGQIACIETLDRPLVVAAGAGSGKTFTLTQRIANALASGYVSDIDEVCAITFTKKAAGELKSRIKAELRARGLVEQALKVDEAWISTIHGMCARILRAHALQLGIDPAFTVAESAQVATYLQQAVDQVLARAQTDRGSERLDALFAEYPATSPGGRGASVQSMLSDLVVAASAQANGVDAFVLPGVTLPPAQAVEQALGIVEDLVALAADQKESPKRDEWIAATEQQATEARELLARGLDAYDDALRVLAPFKLIKTFGGKDYKERVDEARGMLGACVMEARLGAAAAHLDTLIDLTGQALAAFAELKQADGVLDNNDLLVLAARAIEEHPTIAARYADKFKLVMVDEFQDTDQMQVDMIKRLSGEGAHRLCTVGDAQQSIYRFRGADVSVYRRHLESVQAQDTGSVIKLAANFRSHSDVLKFVDCVFARPAMFGGEFMSLSAGRDEAKVAAPFERERPRIVVQHTSRPWRGVNGSCAIAVAARRIAAQFAALAASGHAPGEMVVLLGRMTNADVFAQALRDQGLPCVIAGGSVFARTMEARIVSQLVQVIANPHETQALFNVLTSPLFALTAGDVLKVGGLDGFWRAAYAPEAERPADYSPQLACALRVMGDARRRAGDVPVARIIERVATDSGWLSRMQGEGAEGLASAGNVFKAIRMVDGVERAGARGPVSVMRRFRETLENSKEAPGALSVSGGDSVRIMTIHASKGLEFPIVAVAEVKESRMPLSRLFMASAGGSVYLSLDLQRTLDVVGDAVDADAVSQYVLGDVAGEDELAVAVAEDAGALHRRLAIRSFIAAGDDEEAKRLLYVALTRAKEALVVSSVGVRTKADPLGAPKSALAGVFDALAAQGGPVGEGASSVDFGGTRPALVECVALSADDDEAIASVEKERPPFAVPADAVRPEVELTTFKALHQGIFSYSSLSDAAHEGDVLAQLAQAHAVSADAPSADGRGFGDAPWDRAGGQAAAVDDEFWDVDVSQAFDADRATDLGTAFHRLAQFSVVARPGAGALQPPPADRVEALARTCNLGAVQRARLADALDRWFDSDVARDMAGCADLSAEVPFFVTVNTGDGRAYLEGEIDLLGFSADRAHAFVVDYKTGGSVDESQEELRAKHVLQAACYAYAIMRQGVSQVDATFVRVEQGRADDSGQPQCVRYRFEAGDLAELEQAIARVYSRV